MPSAGRHASVVAVVTERQDAAERLGFRPCLRCRPETAPGSPAWRGTETTVARGMRLIEAGFLDNKSVAALADALGACAD
jgi:AraC family transcriptional regulator of adaptative response/methylated-DNA-[protein]-cysteine methyltransferase